MLKKNLPAIICFATLVSTLVLPGGYFIAAAQECRDGSCTFGGPSASTGGSSAINTRTNTAAQSLEDDYRRKLLLERMSLASVEDEDASARLAPIIGRQPGVPGKLQLTYSSSIQETQFPAFEDDRNTQDREWRAELAIDAKYSLSEETRLLGRLSLRNEWSEDNPEGFRPYDITLLRLDGGIEQELMDNLTGTLKLGTFGIDGAGAGLPEDGAPDPDLLASAELVYSGDNFSIRGGSQRDIFAAPDMEGYKLERVYINYLDINVKAVEKIHFNLSGNALRFTDDVIEDYDIVSGMFTFYPSLSHHFGLNMGVIHEFREEDETIAIGGVEYMRLLGERNSFFTTVQFCANLETCEREINTELILGRTDDTAAHGCAIGISTQYEFNVYNRWSALLFIRLY